MTAEGIAYFHTVRGLALPDFPGLFKKSSFKMADSQRIVRVKTRTKAFFFEEILINIPSENLPKLSKDPELLSCPEAKLKEPKLSRKCKRFFNERLVRTKDNYKFYTAKDPLFNSTGFCKVEDHCRQEHRCDCVFTDVETGYITRRQKTCLFSSYLLVIESSRKHYFNWVLEIYK